MRRVETSINIHKEGRTGHNGRRYVHHSVKKMLDSAATQEGLRLGELFGYFGHTARSLSGKMKPADRDRVMEEFKAGRLDMLVATTVIWSLSFKPGLGIENFPSASAIALAVVPSGMVTVTMSPGSAMPVIGLTP